MARASLKTLSTRDLHAELQRRQQVLPRMEQRRERLLKELREVEAEITGLSNGGAPGRVAKKRRGRPAGSTGKRRRPRNAAPLGEVLTGIMSKKQPMRVSEIAEAVRRTGYKSNARNFGTIVNQTLIKDPRFKQASRGHYVLT